jgi:pilus assembly protein CpaF
MGSMSLPPRAIRTQIASAVDLIIQVERMRDGVRRVSQISEVCGLEGDVITMNEVFTFVFEGEDANGNLLGHYMSPRTRPSFSEKLRYYGLERAWMDALQEMPE